MRVLQVEDEPSTARTVERMLRSDGHDCQTTPLGEEAVRLARDNDYDVILLDVMLPDIDGYEVRWQKGDKLGVLFLDTRRAGSFQGSRVSVPIQSR